MDVDIKPYAATRAETIAFRFTLARVVKGHWLQKMFADHIHLGQLLRLFAIEPETIAETAFADIEFSQFHHAHLLLAGGA